AAQLPALPANWSWAAVERRLQHAAQIIIVERLSEGAVERPGLAGARRREDREDRQGCGRSVPSRAIEQFTAVHPGHGEVGQDEAGATLANEEEVVGSGPGCPHDGAEFLEHHLQRLRLFRSSSTITTTRQPSRLRSTASVSPRGVRSVTFLSHRGRCPA